MCAVPGCRGEVDIVYLGHGVCSHHWNKLADDDSFSRLRMVLGIEREPPTATEVDMSEPTTVEPTTEPKEEAVPKKKATKPKAATTKAAKASKAKTKAPKPQKERPLKEDLVVFACRVAEPERVAFHKATGPAGATRFARKLMVVFSNEDEAGFRALLKEARELRG